MDKTMKAVLLDKPTQAKDITLCEIPIPDVRPGWVLVKIKAFGMDHSEQILRLNEIRADYIRKPIIPGIECVGEIADPSDSDLTVGQKVVALMGGMGRSFHGSYAGYALLPIHHVFAVGSVLSWTEMAAVPETYFTAWGSLFECLCLKPGDTLLIRGATCALGYAAIQIAKAIGCTVIATTHRERKLPLLTGADKAILDTGKLCDTLNGVTKALELVGPKTLPDTLRCVEKGGIVFEIKDAEIEYFDLGVKPIFRESYTLGAGTISEKGYVIMDSCIGCGKCQQGCPQQCITQGKPYLIQQEHCLHCGNCYENCPVNAVQERGGKWIKRKEGSF